MRKAEKPVKSDEFKRFEDFTRKLLAVPKSEVDKEKAKYDSQREKEGKRKRPAG
jgi:hypothetical protein